MDSDLTQWMRWMDECLIAIEDGKPVPTRALDSLPPWRAVLLARVAGRAGVQLEDGTVAEIREAARFVGGEAGPGWWKRALSRNDEGPPASHEG